MTLATVTVVPEGWRRVRLGDVASVEWGNTTLTKAAYVASGFPAYSAAGQDGFVAHFEHDGAGIVLSAIGTVGRIHKADGRWTAIKNTITIAPNNEVSRDFLAAALHDPRIWPSEGGAQPFIGLRKAREVEVTLPPLSEQRCIAAVLQAADDAVAAAEAVIHQTEKVKRGLVEQLLTRGMPGRHTRFKMTEIGEVPESWEVGAISSFGRVVTGRTPATSEATNWGGAVPFVTPGDLHATIGSRIGPTARTLSEAGSSQVPTVPKGSVFFTCIASIGKSGIATTDSAFNQQINSVVPRGGVNPLVLLYALRRNTPTFLAAAGTTAVAIINKRDFAAMTLALPPEKEQGEIADLVGDFEGAAISARRALAVSVKLRGGLGEALLSGRVRVPA